MVNFTVSVTLDTSGFKRLLADAEKQGLDEKQLVRKIIQERYEEKRG